MKKRAFLALVAILLPAAASAQYSIKQNDPSFYFDFDPGPHSVIRGEVWCDGNYLYSAGPWTCHDTTGGLTPSPCSEAIDTFCIHFEDIEGWPVVVTSPGCLVLDDNSNWYEYFEICMTVPCEAAVDDVNTLVIQAAYCYDPGDGEYVCAPDSGDCNDVLVNYRNGCTVATYSYYEVDFVVVESPPAMYILQDTLYIVQQGQTAAYVPFSICNGDPCAPPTNYNYVVTSVGHVGGAINQPGTAESVGGGDCKDVYGVVDAGTAVPCTYDTLTIIAWDEEGTLYDTCVQAIHIVEPIPVPLFTAPVVTILVLAMILAAAVIMKRHAVSKA
jgi:hypothetical protein